MINQFTYEGERTRKKKKRRQISFRYIKDSSLEVALESHTDITTSWMPENHRNLAKHELKIPPKTLIYKKGENYQTLKLFFFTSKPRGAAAASIFEIISLAECLEVNLVSRLTSPWLPKEKKVS
jgi:hypothetical protein